MNLKFSLDENDFLQYHLFDASKSKRLKKQRTTSRIVISVTLLILSLLFLNHEERFFTYYFLIASILSFLFFPLFLKNRHKKHYKKSVIDAYKNRFGTRATLVFTNENIDSKSKLSEIKVNYEAFEEINEIAEYFFLKLKTGGSIIIPKREINNLFEFNALIDSISKKYNLKHNIELDWKWK